LIRVRIGADEHQLGWEEWEERVRSGRVPDDALVQFEAVTRGEWVPAAELEMYRSLRNDAAIAWQSAFAEGPPPVLTALLVGVQIRIWWLARLPDVRSELVERFTNWTAPALENGEVWRPLTMGILHTDLFHIVLNMLWLGYTGWNLERALGRANVLAIYVGAVVAGSMLSMFGSPDTPSLGASGGVFGLVAASTVFGFVRPDVLPSRGRRLFGMAMLPYLLLMFWSGLMNADTDNWSHLGGLLTGLLLGFVLSPPPLERPKGRNRRWQLGVYGTVAATLATLYVVGPRALPLVDHEVARLSRRDRAKIIPVPGYRSLEWSVPSGWQPGAGPGGVPGFRSVAGDRTFAVRERQTDLLASVDAMGEAWLAEVRESWPEARASEQEAATVAGHEGRYLRVVIDPQGEPRGLEWWGAVRGVHTLEVVWTVDLAFAQRLDPLRDRLRSNVVWRDPRSLVSARNDVAYTPNSPRARTELALALAEIGATDEAMALHRQLRLERPDDPDRWIDTFRSVSLGGIDAPVQEALWAEALDRAPTTRVVVDVIAGLDAAGRQQEADGLADAAWTAQPGERLLRRARRRRALSIELTPTGIPWDDAFVPGTAAQRGAGTLETWRAEPLSLEVAARRGTLRATEREAVIRTVCDAFANGRPNDAWGGLLWLRDGAWPEPGSDEAEVIVEELVRAPRWLPDAVLACRPEDAGSLLDPSLAPVRVPANRTGAPLP